jgi:hypothetical protein
MAVAVQVPQLVLVAMVHTEHLVVVVQVLVAQAERPGLLEMAMVQTLQAMVVKVRMHHQEQEQLLMGMLLAAAAAVVEVEVTVLEVMVLQVKL